MDKINELLKETKHFTENEYFHLVGIKNFKIELENFFINPHVLENGINKIEFEMIPEFLPEIDQYGLEVISIMAIKDEPNGLEVISSIYDRELEDLKAILFEPLLNLDFNSIYDSGATFWELSFKKEDLEDINFHRHFLSDELFKRTERILQKINLENELIKTFDTQKKLKV